MNKKLIKEINRINVLMELKNSIDINFIQEQFEKIKPKDSDNTSVQKNYPYRDIPKIKISSSPSDPNEGKYYAYVDENGRDYNPFILTFNKQPSKNTRPISKELYNYLKNKELETKSNIEKNNFLLKKEEPQVIFNQLKKAINYGSFFGKLTPTDEEEILRIVKKIDKDNYLTILFLVLKENYNSIMDFVMTAFYNPRESSVNQYDNESSNQIFQQGGVEKFINYEFNDKWVLQISQHLQQFNNLNSSEGDYTEIENDAQDLAIDSPGTRMATDKELASIAHVVLPIISIVLTLGASSWAVVWLSAGIEIADAALYQFVDKDPYSAGLALIFAFAGPLDNFLAPLIKQFGKSILLKLTKKIAFNSDEKAVIRFVNANKLRLAAITIFEIFKKYIIEFTSRIKSVKIFLGFIIWLVKKGFLIAKSLTHMGLIIGGSFYTWDKIASVLGLCNTVSLKELKQTDYKVLKLIGTAGEYLQPFTKGCKTEQGEKIFKEEDKKLMNTRIILMMDEMINKGVVLTIEYANLKMVETLLLQNALKYFGFSYFVPDENKVKKTVETGKKWNKEKCEAKLFDMDMYALSQHPECDQYFKSNKKISKETEKILNSKPLNSSDYRPEDYGQTIQFKWGYYNKDTENMVKEFQKQYNLVVDGIAGKNTFKKIKNLVENLGDKSIPDYTKFSWTTKEIEKLRKEVIEKLKSTQDKSQENLTEEQVQESFNQQKDSIANSWRKADEYLTPYLDIDDLEIIQVKIDTLIKEDNY